jgi:hypothetical protein
VFLGILFQEKSGNPAAQLYVHMYRPHYIELSISEREKGLSSKRMCFENGDLLHRCIFGKKTTDQCYNFPPDIKSFFIILSIL